MGVQSKRREARTESPAKFSKNRRVTVTSLAAGKVCLGATRCPSRVKKCATCRDGDTGFKSREDVFDFVCFVASRPQAKA